MENNSLNHSRFLSGLVYGFILTFFLTFKVESAVAQSAAGAIQIEPAFQEVELTESTGTASAQIKISNTSFTQQTFELSAVDIQQFDNDGRIILADKPVSGANFSLSSFITIPQTEVTIQPQSSADIPVLVTNSQSLGAGGHYAAVVARLSAETTSDQVVLPAVSSFILVRKQGGEQYNLSLVDSSLNSMFWWHTLPDKLALQFSNQGNSHVIPRGTIDITDQFNRLIIKGIINENSLYIFPNTQRSIEQSLQTVSPVLPISLLHVQFDGTTQPGSVAFHQSFWMVYFDIKGVGILVGVMILLITMMRKIRKRVRKN